MPVNYPGTVWVSDDPKIVYKIPIKPDEDDGIAETEINGRKIEFLICTLYNDVEVFPIESIFINENGEECVDGETILFSGRIHFHKDYFIIFIDKDTDTLFNGQYSTLVFNRVID